MAIPIAQPLGAMIAAEAAKRAVEIAAAAVGVAQGATPDKEEGTETSLFDTKALRRSVIQGAVVTALVIMFFIGLVVFLNRSIRIR